MALWPNSGWRSLRQPSLGGGSASRAKGLARGSASTSECSSVTTPWTRGDKDTGCTSMPEPGSHCATACRTTCSGWSWLPADGRVRSSLSCPAGSGCCTRRVATRTAIRTRCRPCPPPVNRQTLREILAARLADRIHFGRELTGYREHGGVVELQFADGQSASADVLVGADGVRSAVREPVPAACRGHRYRVPVHLRQDAAGRLGAAAPSPPPRLRLGFTAIIGDQVGMAAGAMQFRQRPPDAAAAPWRRTYG